MAVEMMLVLASREFGAEDAPSPGAPPAGYSNTKELGRLLYTDYVFPFELAAVVLLVAIVAAIALTLRHAQGDPLPGPGRAARRHQGGAAEDREDEPGRARPRRGGGRRRRPRETAE